MDNGIMVVPSGGFIYPQALPNGNPYYLKAATRDDLIKTVRQFRLNLNIPVGDIGQDVDDYFEKQKPRQPTDEKSLREKVTVWTAQIQFQAHDLVTPEEAERRAAICSGCPNNKTDWGDSCTECVEHVKKDLYAIRKGQDTQAQLGACEVLAQDNKTAVWMTEKSLRRRSAFKDKLPDFCWVKQLDTKPSQEEVT